MAEDARRTSLSEYWIKEFRNDAAKANVLAEREAWDRAMRAAGIYSVEAEAYAAAADAQAQAWGAVADALAAGR